MSHNTPHAAHDLNAMLTVREVAPLVRKSPYTVRRMCRLGDLPAERVGRDWLFRRAELQSYLEGRQG